MVNPVFLSPKAKRSVTISNKLVCRSFLTSCQMSKTYNLRK